MSHEKIPLAGVLGSPISHSRSPALHGHWLRSLGIRGFYVPMDVTPGDLSQVVATMPRMGFVGCNVTIPHKEAALALADQVSDRAALIGAANTLIFRPGGGVHADNTDGYGFMANLRANAPDWQPSAAPAAVIGAGGASRAVISALIEAKVPEIRLTNRTKVRSEVLRREFGARIVIYDWVDAGRMLSGAGTVVNATSLGMTGKPELKIPLDALSSDALVTDLVYTPLETPLLAAARARGCRVVDGLGMLIHQAVPGFERWFGMRPVVDDTVRDVILKA
ncbi:shikimate dehydrogenase [Profundibacterium mesophilum]|uniref:Shikimate dehydrogenase (NADP(+)) n=1 Tax=Profundibacterium mesophilum KAUST100406-0324 TaxID=1037889 RepID=A0A921NVL4_9RHOB|nr:shikimate dehydrogenase [Profundibacterium mesophilum]KAF0676315.1 Shikimate dehydrogenase [Profundibacterium mesophilum KAUST100406-0324]